MYLYDEYSYKPNDPPIRFEVRPLPRQRRSPALLAGQPAVAKCRRQHLSLIRGDGEPLGECSFQGFLFDFFVPGWGGILWFQMDSGQFTILLEKWSRGDKSALQALTPIVYRELRKLAAASMSREREDHTLTPTALLHEAYLKLVDHKQDHWHGRAHFYAVASHLMREILIEHARKHQAAKRGGGQAKVSLDDAVALATDKSDIVVALDEALLELAKQDERKAKLIELKYFGGLSGTEIAQILNISISTITRESRMAEAWLQRYIKRYETRTLDKAGKTI